MNTYEQIIDQPVPAQFAEEETGGCAAGGIGILIFLVLVVAVVVTVAKNS